MKIGHLDIESAPITAYVWGLWDQRVATNQIIDTGRILCWAAKWHGQKKIHFDAEWEGGKEEMLWGIRDFMDESDVLVHHNGLRYDLPVLRREFLKNEIPPPSPSKQIDTLRVARQQFKFESNKLDYLAEQLGIGNKVKHEGFGLWIKCMDGVASAQRKMKSYNRHDVVLLEEVYEKLLPYIINHPVHGTYSENGHVCPKCGSGEVQKRGIARTTLQQYQRYQCKSCGGWSRGAENLTPKGKNKEVLRNAG